MILLDHGADVAATDVNGETALELATDSDVIGALVPSHVERLMLERVPSPLRQALFDGIQKALQNSARVGDTQTVELLTGLGANGEEEVAAQRAEATLMFLAAQVNDMMVVNALLQAGCDPFVSAGPNGCTTAGVAAENGHAEVLKLILAMPFDKRSVSWVTGPVTSLAVTAQNGHTECVRLLLKAGAAVDGVGHAGITPLVFAVRNGHKEIAHVLLEAGADRSILEGPRYSSVGSTRPSVSEADLQTVMDFTGCDPERARNCLEAAGGDAEQAINIFLGSG
jgi:ankyrin repeat protein